MWFPKMASIQAVIHIKLKNMKTYEDLPMVQTMHLRIERWAAPICPLLLVTDDEGVLRALEFADHESRMERLLQEHYDSFTLEKGEAPVSLTRALRAYFDGNLNALADVHTATGGTSFQREVWNALREIPAGTTTSYGELAKKLGRVGASRAVGAANGANPIPIVVPCHRVIGANGTLTGYGGGLAHKKWLLEHEARFASIAGHAGIPQYLV
jgi:methylated-DNA-[protein]-cysteine S-methyltransferase